MKSRFDAILRPIPMLTRTIDGLWMALEHARAEQAIAQGAPCPLARGDRALSQNKHCIVLPSSR